MKMIRLALPAVGKYLNFLFIFQSSVRSFSFKENCDSSEFEEYSSIDMITGGTKTLCKAERGCHLSKVFTKRNNTVYKNKRPSDFYTVNLLNFRSDIYSGRIVCKMVYDEIKLNGDIEPEQVESYSQQKAAPATRDLQLVSF